MKVLLKEVNDRWGECGKWCIVCLLYRFASKFPGTCNVDTLPPG